MWDTAELNGRAKLAHHLSAQRDLSGAEIDVQTLTPNEVEAEQTIDAGPRWGRVRKHIEVQAGLSKCGQPANGKERHVLNAAHSDHWNTLPGQRRIVAHHHKGRLANHRVG